MPAPRPSSPPPPTGIRVHGSTSNLGPGFDLLGLCLSLALEVRVVREADEWALVEAEGEARALADAELLFEALRAGAQLAGGSSPPLHVAMRSEIPIARGLGSSGAAVAAGLLLGAARTGAAIDDALRLRLALAGADLEGHPDNVAASMFGGCTLALPHANELRLIQPPVHPSLAFVVAWGATPLATERARAALPAEVPIAAAIENARRLPFLLRGLAHADRALLELGIEDRLHVEHRLALIRGGAEALRAAREAGAWAATVSGAGSSLVALVSQAETGPVAEALQRTLETLDGPARAFAATPVLGAPEPY